jgi:hypothetical protein
VSKRAKSKPELARDGCQDLPLAIWASWYVREGGRRRVGDGKRGNGGHSIDVEMEVASSGISMVCTGSCRQCMDAREVRESKRQTKHSLQYVCAMVRSARSRGVTGDRHNVFGQRSSLWSVAVMSRKHAHANEVAVAMAVAHRACVDLMMTGN